MHIMTSHYDDVEGAWASTYTKPEGHIHTRPHAVEPKRVNNRKRVCRVDV